MFSHVDIVRNCGLNFENAETRNRVGAPNRIVVAAAPEVGSTVAVTEIETAAAFVAAERTAVVAVAGTVLVGSSHRRQTVHHLGTCVPGISPSDFAASPSDLVAFPTGPGLVAFPTGPVASDLAVGTAYPAEAYTVQIAFAGPALHRGLARRTFASAVAGSSMLRAGEASFALSETS